MDVVRIRLAGALRRRLSLARQALWPVVSIEGVRVHVDRGFSNVVRRAMFGGYYELAELVLIGSVIEPSDTVMEIGTGVGLVACFSARTVGSAKVFTYEANPALEKHIRRNFSLNNVSPRLRVCAVGERAGRGTFFVSDNFWGSSALRVERATPIGTEVVSFDAEIRRVRPTLVIIDAEGGEAGLVGSTSFPGVRKLVIEIHRDMIGDGGADHVISRLLELGFEVRDHSGESVLLARC